MLANKDKALRAELKERERAFVNDQLMRYQELIMIMEIREKGMEKICSRKQKPLDISTKNTKRRSRH